jgi:hypothetical protein
MATKAFIIKASEEITPVAEICRKIGINQAAYFNWKKKYAGMLPTDVKKLLGLTWDCVEFDRRVIKASKRPGEFGGM